MRQWLRGWPGFIARRLAMTALTLWGLATLVFVMVKLIPGDEAQVAAGAEASPEQIEAVRQRLGLDASALEQYVRFIGRALHGDLGTSIATFQPVLIDIERVLPSTIELVVVAMAVNLVVAIPLATVAAARRGGVFDGIARVLAVVGGGVPIFWLALICQFLFGRVWRVLPLSGLHAYGFSAPVITGMPTVDAVLAGNGRVLDDAVLHLVLPAAVLAVAFGAQIFRTLRASLLSVLQNDFIVPVRAKGASPTRILLRHALPNGISPTVTLAGVQIGGMIGAAVLVESVFARPGIGSYLANAVVQKDSFAVLGTVLFIGAIVCVANFGVDIFQAVLDPRLRAATLGAA